MFWDTQHSSKKPDRICSFCGNNQSGVRNLIESPVHHTCDSCRSASTVWICEECIQSCTASITRDNGAHGASPSLPSVIPKPTEIKATSTNM